MLEGNTTGATLKIDYDNLQELDCRGEIKKQKERYLL